jgi:hypothetical protein
MSTERTIHHVIDAITLACHEQGIDVSAGDVGFICAEFIKAVAHPDLSPIQNIIDACESVKSETDGRH